jgi:intraflagellar transport protein 88
MYNMALDSTTM